MNKRIPVAIIAVLFSCMVINAEVLRLSMEETIAAALEKNFSIRIQSIEPDIAKEDLRMAAGAFDPVVESEYRYAREELSPFTTDEESASFRFGVGSTLPWGMTVNAEVNTNDQTTPFDTYTGRADDYVSSFAGIVVTQPLLRNFGMAGTYAPVRIARESVSVSWEQFRSEVMDTVAAAVQAYQNLYLAQENLRIAERNRDLALQLLADNRRRMETGVMAPLDIVQAESEAALREVSVISARSFMIRSRNTLKALIWDQPDTVLDLDLEILPPREPVRFEPDLSRDFRMALASLPEYRATQSGLEIRKLELTQYRRNALPQLDIVGSYGQSSINDSVSNSLEQSFQDGDSSYSIGAIFSVPFPNRSRSAQKVQAYLRRNQAELQLKQVEQTILLELDNAATRLTADWDRIQAARTARELAEKSLKAEEKKLQVGTSSTFVVLRLQGDLANAEIREINALTDYAVSLAQYERARGHILDVYNVSLADRL